MTIFKKNALPCGKKCIFISRGNKYDILLRRTNIDNYRMLDPIQDRRHLEGSENQKNGRGNESKGNERKQNICGYSRNETLISKKYTEGLWP